MLVINKHYSLYVRCGEKRSTQTSPAFTMSLRCNNLNYPRNSDLSDFLLIPLIPHSRCRITVTSPPQIDPTSSAVGLRRFSCRRKPRAQSSSTASPAYSRDQNRPAVRGRPLPGAFTGLRDGGNRGDWRIRKHNPGKTKKPNYRNGYWIRLL